MTRTVRLTDAQLLLGQASLDNDVLPVRALDWFRAAARGGDARAVNMLGRCHERGWGVGRDPARAAAYFRRAADLGDGWALFNLADLFLRGEGVAQDDARAAELYAEAARKGVDKALNMLGVLAESGRGLPADPDHARAYFLAAAQAGDCWGCFNHARLLIGDGRVDAALPWLHRALECGFPDFFRAMAGALAGHDDARLRLLARRAAEQAS